MSQAEEWWSRDGGAASPSPNHACVTEYALHVAEEHAAPLLSLGAPIAVSGAEGPHVHDVAGGAYIDLRSGGGMFPLGHRPPVVVRALIDALDRVDMGDWQLPSPHRTAFARALSDTMLEGNWQWRFFASGSEGNEFALRTALLASGRSRILALHGGYHGQTGLAAAVTDQRHLGCAYPGIAAEVRRIAPGDLEGVKEHLDEQVAAVILEPVQLTDGVRPVPHTFLRALRERCDATGAVLVFDEVKCGLNRTGGLWAHHDASVTPDILVAGKALSAGVFPVAATGVRADTSNVFLRQHKHDARSSYGGSHLGTIVGSAALRELADPGNRRRFQDNGRQFEEELAQRLTDVLGARLTRYGMAFEIELGDELLALFVAADLLHRRVIVPFPKSSALVLLPPLAWDRPSMAEAASKIAAAVAVGKEALDAG